MAKVLIFGPGWMGHKYADYFHAELSDVRIHENAAVERELDRAKPDIVINTAGKTGRPNIDWCEDHKLETIESNITGPLVLLKTCSDRAIRLVHLSSGCIFTGTPPSGKGFTETDTPNPVSFYSWSKAMADEILQRFPVLILRLRMPISSEKNPRNLITKIAGYSKIIDVENSVTVVDDLLRATKELIEKKCIGIYNITNPGTLTHRNLMAWYTEFVDPSHRYELIGADQLEKQGLAKTGRSNCILDTTKLEQAGVHLPEVSSRVQEMLRIYKFS